MKKSKVIVPAMALLLFSTAASVTSTVAWFTSTRTFETKVGQFNVVELDGNLQCTMAGIADGGTATIEDGKAVKLINTGADDSGVPAVLTHGSVDVATQKAYVIDPDNSAAFIEKAANADWSYKKNVTIPMNSTPQNTTKEVDVYVAVRWTMTFKYNFAADTHPVGVYLDLAGSEFKVPESLKYDFTKSAEEQQSLLDSKKGFRVGFTTTQETGNHDFVWGNNTPVETAYTAYTSTTYEAGAKVTQDGVVYQAAAAIETAEAWTPSHWKPTGEISLKATAGDTGNSYNAKYVSGEVNPTNISEYNATNYVVHKNEAKLGELVEYEETLERASRVCVLKPGVGNDTVTINCSAWFEGTDPNIVSGTALSCLQADMKFYARTLNTGAKPQQQNP